MSKTALEYWMHWHAIIVFRENGGTVIRIMSLFISLTGDILRCWHVVRANGCPGSHGKPFGIEGDLQRFHKSHQITMIPNDLTFDLPRILRPWDLQAFIPSGWSKRHAVPTRHVPFFAKLLSCRQGKGCCRLSVSEGWGNNTHQQLSCHSTAPV